MKTRSPGILPRPAMVIRPTLRAATGVVVSGTSAGRRTILSSLSLRSLRELQDMPLLNDSLLIAGDGSQLCNLSPSCPA